MRFVDIERSVREYYTGRLEAHGATPAGVDWPSAQSQRLRFDVLLGLCDRRSRFSVNDYGCGYGALLDYLRAGGYRVEYCGFDLAPRMIECARRRHARHGHCRFVVEEGQLRPADYTVASGVFNVKLRASDEEWKEYVLHSLEVMRSASVKGFAFNMLSAYADRERMREDLYYGDPLFFFDYCRRRFSRRIALRHDYPLYEFTILVRT